MFVNNRSMAQEKIRLFRGLFRGREEVYPRRFESRRTGKSGYAPVCANEWVTGLCDKPRIKCAQCRHRRFLPLTDDVIRSHLSGHNAGGRDFVVGIYPMLRDETCFFVSVDFDKAYWQDDASAYLDTCRRLELPAALERSRSGNGGHVWLFFAEPVSAGLARRLAAHVLTETMERRPELGMDSYDRFFPNQDTLPRGGFGNLIALPLQKKPRERGNSVFVDERFSPYDDQWLFLSKLGKISTGQAEAIVHDAQSKGRIVGVRFVAPDQNCDSPWTLAPSRRRRLPPINGTLPAKFELILANEIYIRKDALVPALRYQLLCLAAFQNPEFYRAQAMRLPTYDKPRIISCAEDHDQHISLPRGCLDDVKRLLSQLQIKPVICDQRYAGKPLMVSFHGELRAEQDPAAKTLLKDEMGVLSASTAFGKTVIAASLIAERGVNTLVIVHRRQLLEQWILRLSEFLGMPTSDIGRIGGGRRRATGMLDVALIQSLRRKSVVDDCVGDYGHIVVDECHHVGARSFEEVLRRAKAKYITGLSATVQRKDGLHPIVFMQCGPIRYRVDAKKQAANRPFDHTIHVCPTSFQPQNADAEDPQTTFHNLYEQLIADDDRNRAICDQVVKSVDEGRSPVVLTERIAHLDRLIQLLKDRVRNLVVLRGGMAKKKLDAATSRSAEIPDNEPRLLMATGPFLGEGFDDARLDTLFLTLPVSWRGTIAQYVGRLHRLHDGKREARVYDYADLNVPMLARMFDRRCKGYESVGYKVLLPASAVPGWPTDSPLPVDPAWKRDYAATVRRLARDGVDSSLAGLFHYVSRDVEDDAEGECRARSATEAFLFRRLESLPETVGKFRLNVKLPIPFDGHSQMEVDLVCAEAKLAVELDGLQHLSDTEAYRCDRRKDAMLQEHGYLVLRFLADDVGKNLDLILDSMLRALARRDGTERVEC